MAISFNFGAGSQGTAVTKNLQPWNYSTAFRAVTDNGSLARMNDILSPLDKQTVVKLTNTKIANVYTTLADGSIPMEAQSANTTGHTVFVELKTIATKTVGDATIMIPMVSRIEVRLPDDADIAETDVTTLIMATFACLCNAAGAPVVVTEKMRGALVPAGI